jgi:vancomycin permeability regulator SanA
MPTLFGSTRRSPNFIQVFLIAALISVLIPICLIVFVWTTTSEQRFSEPSNVPPERIAVVFGAGVWTDGTPSPMLADRVRAAVELYQSNRVTRLLMTGDNRREDYDEVGAMRRYAMERGVPSEDITLDHAGLSTYDSCYRAREIFGVREAVLVTQQFHLPRAVYTCQGLGVDAVGLGTPDWGRYRDGVVIGYTAREMLATLNALWQVHVARPEPRYLGPVEDIALLGSEISGPSRHEFTSRPSEERRFYRATQAGSPQDPGSE